MSSLGQIGRATAPPPGRAIGAPAALAAARPRITGALYAGAVFLAAFLLFQVEPIMGRLILPWFGGSAAVWTVTVLFFQVVLVLGYLYAHLLVRHVQPRRQMLVHVPVLLASLLVLPILPAASWKPIGRPGSHPEDPRAADADGGGAVLRALHMRSAAAGVVLTGDGRPYRLFSLSNAASLLGLLSYPLLVEPRLGTHAQADRGRWPTRCSSCSRSAITVRAGLAAEPPSPALVPAVRAIAPGWWTACAGSRSPRPPRCCSSRSPTT